MALFSYFLNMFMQNLQNTQYKFQDQFKSNILLFMNFYSLIHLFFLESGNEQYYMSNYVELTQRIFSHSKESKAEALRKLIYLSVNDQSKFSNYVPQIAQQLPKTLTDIEDQQVKLLSLQLLAQMATNYTSKIPVQCYSFPQLVSLLSDQNGQVRKASHYLILIFIKKYQQIDSVIEGYLERIRESPQHWKILQKIIHSFQSLLVIQPKCITYSQDYSHLDDFMRILLENRNHHHSLVQKASEQTVNSFVKNQYVPQILPKLDRHIMRQLVEYAQKISINLQPKKKSPNKQLKQLEDIQQIQIVHRKTSVIQQLLLKLDSETDWKIKSETIQQISNQLSNGNSDIPEDLIEKVLDLTYDYNFKTCITAMNVLLTITTLYPHKLANRHRQIQDVVIDKVCDLKMAVRQVANKILRNLYPNQSKDFLKRILTKLGNCSIVGKQQILNFLQEVFTSNIVTDLGLVLGEVSNQLLNQNTRVKIKAIDCLVKISTANQLQQCKLILSKKLNKVYYDMYLQRLKEKLGIDKQDTWDQKVKLKKGLTWQAPQRSMPLTQPNQKQASTKIQFGNKKNFNETQQDFAFSNTIQNTKEKGLSATSNSYKTSNTVNSFNSFNTFKSTEENQPVNSKIQKKISQNTKPNSYFNFESQQQSQMKQPQKKIPMKPTPIKKKNTMEANKEDNNPLVVQSKQYQNKINEQEPQSDHYGVGFKSLQKKHQQRKQSIEQKPKMKINKMREKSSFKSKQQQIQQVRQTKQVASQPFSIKKSGSKKQHIIDYKATHYAAKDDLSPLDNPKQTLKFIMTNLPKDNDWNKQFESLDLLRRIIKNHEEFYPMLNQSMQGIMPQVLKLVQSLRSSVAKNAMITLSQMCEALKKSMDPYLQAIFIKLFKKAQDTNAFILDQVRKCITSLCSYCTSSKICIVILNNSNAKAIPIKTNVVLCIDKLLQKKEYDCQLLKQNTKIVNVMSNLIIDGSAQVRNSVKEIFIQLLDYNGATEIEGLFKRNSSKDSWDRWRNIIDKEGAQAKK